MEAGFLLNSWPTMLSSSFSRREETVSDTTNLYLILTLKKIIQLILKEGLIRWKLPVILDCDMQVSVH